MKSLKKVLMLCFIFLTITIGCFGLTGCGAKNNPPETNDGGETKKETEQETGVNWEKAFTVSDDGSTITGLSKYGSKYYDLVIPESINGKNITAIGDSAFEGETNIARVVVGNNVETIGNNAFKESYGLLSVTLSQSVTTIGDSAFSSCLKLTEVINKSSLEIVKGSRDYGGVASMASSVETKGDSRIKFIEDYAFFEYVLHGYYGTATELVLPESYKDEEYTISAYAFYKNKKITSVNTGGAKNIYYMAFSDCQNLENVVVGECLRAVWPAAFSNCEKLEFNSFGDAKYLGSLNNPYHVLIETDSKNITNFTINQNCKVIANQAFKNCEKVCELILPDSVEVIGEDSFTGCRNLMRVVFGKNLKEINQVAFVGCKIIEIVNKSDYLEFQIDKKKNYHEYQSGGIEKIDCVALNVKTTDESEFIEKGDFIFYTAKDVNYLVAYKGNSSEITLPESFNGQSYEIYARAFWYNQTISSVTMGENVTDIGVRAFSNCYKLAKVELGENTKRIWGGAFLRCYSLTSLETNENLKSIGKEAFSRCYGLTSFKNKSVKPADIGDSAFQYCHKLVEVICNNVTKGSDSAGYVAYYALNIKNPNADYNSDIVNQDGFLFYTYDNQNYLLGYVGDETEIVLPEKYNGQDYKIYKYAFNKDVTSDLTSVVISDGVTEIGERVFYQSPSLLKIVLSSSVKSIGNYAFLTRYAVLYYKGTEAELKPFIAKAGLTTTKKYYYVEKEQDVPNDGGNYWHYDANGEIAVWEK